MSRREERECAFSLLYEYTYHSALGADDFLAKREEYNETVYSDFVKNAFCGTICALGEIDGVITEYAVGWKVSRMSRVTKSVLRLALYEIIFTETPPKAVINEAVELAKKYGEDKAAGFVNGILNKYAKESGKLSDAPLTEDEK